MRSPLPAPFADWPRPLAFVLSGGGAFGPVQLGMLRALADRGVEPDIIVGTSVGALHGAAIAAQGYDALDELEDLWKTMNRSVVFGGRRAAASSMLRNRTISDGRRLAQLIDRRLQVHAFEELLTPFAAVATDASTGDPQLLSQGSIHDALLASCAVPGLFPRVEIDGRSYVDGGVAANVPIRQAIAFGAQSVVSLDATPPTIATELPQSFVGSLLHSASLALRAQRSNAVDDIAHRFRIATLPSATPPDMGSFNFAHTEVLLRESHRLAAATLDQWADDNFMWSAPR